MVVPRKSGEFQALSGALFLAITSTLMAKEDVPFGTKLWWIYAGISLFLIIFAGLMSGLTLGLMSLSILDIEVLQRSGTPKEKAQAAAIYPVVHKQHQLLVTLLLCNAAAMEALPIFLDMMFNPVTAVILSVTFVLIFGEVIPQAVCARYGLAIGANLIWLVQILMVICFPISYPLGKILDKLLGPHDTMFRRPQLKAFVSIHSREAGKGGELSHDETTIISGALDLTEKTAEEAMTPIESTFSLDVTSKLDWEAMGRILARGHSRVPVYAGSTRNIVGILLVKSLLTVRPEGETPVSAVSIRKIPRVPADMSLYDILNEFQKGNSHMAAVVRRRKLVKSEDEDYNNKPNIEKCLSIDKEVTIFVDSKPMHDDWHDLEDAEVIGIITLEDVMEELLQEEIVDETDEYVDVHKRIRVAGALSKVSSTAVRSLSFRALAAKQQQATGTSPKKLIESHGKQMVDPILEPLLGTSDIGRT